MNAPAFELIETAEDRAPAQPTALAVQPGTTPADLMRVAMAAGSLDLDRMERLMAMQVQWEEREAVKAFNEAFAAFKAEAVEIVKNRRVTDGPLKGKSYAELFSVVNAVTPALSKHGLSASWRLTKDEPTWLEVTCTLKHLRGHAETVSMGGPPDAGGAKNAIQARASTISYLERYTLKAICGVAEGGEDDDGRGGGGKQEGEAFDTELSRLIDQGIAQSEKGMKSLTDWWGSLTAKQRSSLNKEFPRMRQTAKNVDAGGNHV